MFTVNPFAERELRNVEKIEFANRELCEGAIMVISKSTARTETSMFCTPVGEN